MFLVSRWTSFEPEINSLAMTLRTVYAGTAADLSGQEDDYEYLQRVSLYAVGVNEWLEYVVVYELCDDEDGQDDNQEEQQRHLHAVVDMVNQPHKYGQDVSDERPQVWDDVEYA